MVQKKSKALKLLQRAKRKSKEETFRKISKKNLNSKSPKTWRNGFENVLKESENNDVSSKYNAFCCGGKVELMKIM